MTDITVPLPGFAAPWRITAFQRYLVAFILLFILGALNLSLVRSNAPFAELVRLSRTSIADEMRFEHTRRVLGE